MIKLRDKIIIGKDEGGTQFAPKDSLKISKELKMGKYYQSLEFQIEYHYKGGKKIKNYSLTKMDSKDLMLNYHLSDPKEIVESKLRYEEIVESILNIIKEKEEEEKMELIRYFAENVLNIIERKDPINIEGPQEIEEASINTGSLILTSERFRSEIFLLIAFIEFSKLQLCPNSERLKNMFEEPNCTLFYPSDCRKIPDEVKITEAFFDPKFKVPFEDKIQRIWNLHEFNFVLNLFNYPKFEEEAKAAKELNKLADGQTKEQQLIESSEKGYLCAVKKLLEEGADINAKGWDKRRRDKKIQH